MMKGSNATNDDENGREEWIARLEERVRRRKEGDEGVSRETLEAYPILHATSLMHFCAPPHPDMLLRDHDAVMLARWSASGCDGRPREGREPVWIDTTHVMVLAAASRSIGEKQMEFLDLVISNPEKDVIGYWHTACPKQDTIDMLALRTGNAVVLTRGEKRARCHFSYEDLSMPASGLFTFIQGLEQKMREAMPELAKAAEAAQIKSPGVCAVYMVDFTPVDVLTVRMQFPKARIIGISTPRPTDDEAMLKVLSTLRAVAISRKALKEAGK